MTNRFKSSVALAIVLAFNSGAFAHPKPPADDDGDVSLISSPAKPSFGERMAKARASKGSKTKTPKGAKHHKARAAKIPHAPKAPAIDQAGD
jgi:hypothetical protein